MSKHHPRAEPVDVCISVDVEFSINRALTNPGRKPVGAEWVYGRSADGRSQGLGVLLDCLDQYRLKGTFFTEVLNTCYFGDGPMQGVIADLLDRGQDVQLHLHPVWRYFRQADWYDRLARGERPEDRFTSRDPAEIVDWLREGVEILTRLAGCPPLAFRSGNLDAGRVLYQGMAAAGIRLASNIGIGLKQPREPELAFAIGRHLIEGVTEVPVTSYRMPLTRQRLLLLTITGSSFGEMRAVLQAAARQGIGPIVVLLHPHDLHFALGDYPTDPPMFKADALRQRRFRQLCAYLAARPEQFRVTTFAAAAARWLDREAPKPGVPPIRGPLGGFATRVIQNRVWPLFALAGR